MVGRNVLRAADPDVPDRWLQVHHLEDAHYEKFFRGGLTDAHRTHDAIWHPSG